MTIPPIPPTPRKPRPKINRTPSAMFAWEPPPMTDRALDQVKETAGRTLGYAKFVCSHVFVAMPYLYADWKHVQDEYQAFRLTLARLRLEARWKHLDDARSQRLVKAAYAIGYAAGLLKAGMR